MHLSAELTLTLSLLIPSRKVTPLVVLAGPFGPGFFMSGF